MNLHEVLELIQLRWFERDPVKRLLNRTHLPDDLFLQGPFGCLTETPVFEKVRHLRRHFL